MTSSPSAAHGAVCRRLLPLGVVLALAASLLTATAAPARADEVVMSLPAGHWTVTGIVSQNEAPTTPGPSGDDPLTASFNNLAVTIDEDATDRRVESFCGDRPDNCNGGEAIADPDVTGGHIDVKGTFYGFELGTDHVVPTPLSEYGRSVTQTAVNTWIVDYSIPRQGGGYGDLYFYITASPTVGASANSLGGGAKTSPVGHRGDPVNTLSGDFFYQRTLAQVRDQYGDLDFTTSYNSRSHEPSPLGQGWTGSYLRHIDEPDSNGAAVVQDDGDQLGFTLQPDGTYTALGGTNATLTKDSSGYTFAQDGEVDTFDPNGAWQHATLPSGQILTGDHDSQGRLSAVHGASQTLSYAYNDAGQLLSVALDDGRHADLTYTASTASTGGTGGTGATDGTGGGLLATSSNLGGDSETYHYDDHGRVLQILDTAGRAVLSNTYNSYLDRVATQTDALGHVTTFTLLDRGDQIAAQTTGAAGSGGFDSYTPGTGQRLSSSTADGQATYGYDSAGRLNRVVDGDGSTSDSTYLYNSGGDLTRAVTPAGQVSAVYDTDHHLLRSQTDQQPVVTHDYDSSGRLVSTTGTDGGTTALSYAGDAHSPSTVTAPDGSITRFGYDARGNTSSVTDPDGNTTTYAYDPSNRVVSATDPRGNTAGARAADFTTHLDYDNTDELLRSTDPTGHSTSWTYADSGLVASSTDQLGRTTRNTYDAADNLTSTTDPLGRTSHYEYDQAGRPTVTTDPRGLVTSATYNDLGQLVRVDKPGRGATVLTYDGNGLVASATSSTGGVTTYQHDEAGDLTQVITARGNIRGNDPRDYTTTYAYDSNHQLTTTTAPDGGVTRTTYDPAGRVTATTDPLGRSSTTSYGSNGQVVRTASPSGAATRYDYTPAGRLRTSTDPLGRATTYAYTPAGQLASTTTPGGHTTRYTYDALGRLTATIDPRAAYGPTAPWTTSYSYDAAGEQTSTTTALGETTSTAYDPAGQVSSRTDALGLTTRYDHDPDGNLTTVTSPSGRISTLTYDGAGDVLTRTDGNGHTSRWTYNTTGQLLSGSRPSGATTTYGYDPDANLTSRTTPAGNTATATAAQTAAATTTYTYDGQDRLLKTAYGPGSTTTITGAAGALTQALSVTTPSVTNTYDLAGQLSSRLDGTGTTRYTYDPDGRLLSSLGARSLRYTYDTAGQLTQRTLGDGSSSKLTYTPDGLPSSQLLSSSGSSTARTDYTYDPAGNLLTRALPDGTTEQRTYDVDSRLTAIADRNSTGTPYAQTRTLDADSRPTLETSIRTGTGSSSATSSTGYSYDPDSQLTRTCAGTCTSASATTGSWTYDNAGNRTRSTDSTGAATTYTYDQDDQLLTSSNPTGQSSYRYDQDGQLTTQTSPSKTATGISSASNPVAGAGSTLPAKVTQYGYDAAQRLAVSTDGTRLTRSTYDGNDQLSTSSDSLLTAAGTQQLTNTNYTWDTLAAEPQLLSRTTATSSTAPVSASSSQNISWGPGGPETLTTATTGASSTGSTRRDYLDDALGSTTATINTDQSIASSTTYDPWGVSTTTTSPSTTSTPAVPNPSSIVSSPATAVSTATALITNDLTSNPLGFTSGLNTLQGCVTLGARTYDPTTGRFTQHDPLSAAPQQTSQLATNAYAYARNQPTLLIDPLGLQEHQDHHWYSRVYHSTILNNVGGLATAAANTALALGPTILNGYCDLSAVVTSPGNLDNASQNVDSCNKIFKPISVNLCPDPTSTGCTTGKVTFTVASVVVPFLDGATLARAGEFLSQVNAVDRVEQLINGVRTFTSRLSAAGKKIASRGAGTEDATNTLRPLTSAEQSTLDDALRPAKLDHIFVPKHNLDPLIQQFGSREAAMEQIVRGIGGPLPQSGPFEVIQTIGGQSVVIRGATVNGIPRIGTAFTP